MDQLLITLIRPPCGGVHRSNEEKEMHVNYNGGILHL